MNKDYLAMMDEGELEAYAKVLGFTTAAAQTAADKAKLIEQKRGRCAELTVLGIAMSIPVKRAHDRRFIDAMNKEDRTTEELDGAFRFLLGDEPHGGRDRGRRHAGRRRAGLRIQQAALLGRTKKLLELADLEERHLPLLRHDFRAYYGCCYDEVGVAEAYDLVRTLPDGSLTVAALHPERSWTREQHLAADIVDSVYAAATALCGGKASEAPRVPRPRDVAAAGAAAERAASVRDRIENTEWVEVTDG